MDLKLRRRAIYTGMRPYFEDDALLEALKLWQEKYSNTPKFAFTEFLSVCCQTKELRQQRSSILSSIFKAMDLPEHQLLKDPFDELNNEVVIATQTNKLEIDHYTLVFMKFFEMLFNKVSDKEALVIRASIINNSKKLTIDGRRKVFLQDWLDKKVERLEYGYELSVIRQVVNFSYIAMCEYFGPVKADQLLAQAIKETEATASQYDVKLHDFL
jgi:hypothetical protein